jgi:hypothetical protein
MFFSFSSGASANLTNLQNWWSGLPIGNKKKPENKERLILLKQF